MIVKQLDINYGHNWVKLGLLLLLLYSFIKLFFITEILNEFQLQCCTIILLELQLQCCTITLLELQLCNAVQ